MRNLRGRLRGKTTMTPQNKRIQEFIKALKVAVLLDFSKWAVFTHAWHESGTFKHIIGNYGYWGIKKPKDWQGKTISVRTHEYINGKRISVMADFIDFDSAKSAMSWYCNFIRRLYPNAYENRNDPVKYFEGLVNGKLKYATDPNYPQKLISLYKVLKDETDNIFLMSKV